MIVSESYEIFELLWISALSVDLYIFIIYILCFPQTFIFISQKVNLTGFVHEIGYKISPYSNKV